MIHLLTKEGSASIYHEFTTILECTYPKLDALQELHAMQAWLYINPFEHTGHFVNGWLRRGAQAKAKQSSSSFFYQTRSAKQTKSVKPSKKAQSIKAVGSRKADAPTTTSNQARPIKSNQTESKSPPPHARPSGPSGLQSQKYHQSVRSTYQGPSSIQIARHGF